MFRIGIVRVGDFSCVILSPRISSLAFILEISNCDYQNAFILRAQFLNYSTFWVFSCRMMYTKWNMMVLQKAIQVPLALGLWCGVLMGLWCVFALWVVLLFRDFRYSLLRFFTFCIFTICILNSYRVFSVSHVVIVAI